MEGPGVAHWPEVAQGLRHAGACLKDCSARARRRRELAFGSRQQPREGDDDPREENEPKSATGGKVRGREGAAQEVSNEKSYPNTSSHLKTENILA